MNMLSKNLKKNNQSMDGEVECKSRKMSASVTRHITDRMEIMFFLLQVVIVHSGVSVHNQWFCGGLWWLKGC